MSSVESEVGLRQFAPSTQAARKQRVLVVEDNSWIALSVADEVEARGGAVVGPASTLSEALVLARTPALDAALVDLTLGDETSFAVAQVLIDRHIPFVFMTGSSEPLEAPFKDVAVLMKPFRTTRLREALTSLLGSS